jgi:hypothetical protein
MRFQNQHLRNGKRYTNRMKRPTKVLCKRSLIVERSEFEFFSPKRERYMLVAGDWYNVVYNENDTCQTFSIIDNQGKRHLFYVYTRKDRKSWPDFCKKYGPRDYSKWFYTPQELEKRNERRSRRQDEEAIRG